MKGMTEEQYLAEVTPLLDQLRGVCDKYDIPMVAAAQIAPRTRAIFHHPCANGASPFGRVICFLNDVEHPDELPTQWIESKGRH